MTTTMSQGSDVSPDVHETLSHWPQNGWLPLQGWWGGTGMWVGV